MKRAKITFIGAIIIGGLTLGGWLYLTSFSQQEETIRIGYNIESINHSPIIVAYEKKLFSKHGINVKMVPLKSGGEIKQAIALGKIDIGSAGATNFFIPILIGAPVKIIAPSTLSPSFLFVNPDSNIKTFKDLIGRTIASRIGSSSNLALHYALKKEGIDINSMNFIDIDKSLRPIALMEKKVIDVSVGGEYEETIYLESGAEILQEWITKGYVHQSLPRTVIAVNTDFLMGNSEKVERFLDAFIDGQAFIKFNSEEAAKLVAEHITLGTEGAIQFSPEDVLGAWEKIEFALWYDPNVLVDISEIAKDIGDIEKTLTLEEIYDLRFQQKLKTAHNEIYEQKN